ncbi:MAG: DUF1453 domain-containing protein [Pseudoxanthomonas suwonensis]|nr:DUF1453 domain-containing protein [Pseudoxanthomonas suwonensis]
MPLLIVPLAILLALFIALLLTPVSLWMRYRSGRARRRLQPWVVTANSWMLLMSAVMFLGSAWVIGHWVEGASGHAALGLVAGLPLGVLGLVTSHFETTAKGVHVTPNRWLVLVLTLLVAARIGWGLWRLVLAWRESGTLEASMWNDQANLFAVGGVLLGYYVAWGWGLRRKLRQR